MTDQQEARLSEISARVGAATAGPWKADSGFDGRPFKDHGNQYHHFEITTPAARGHWVAQVQLEVPPAGSDGLANAQFIAHAREDVPYLLETVALLRGALEAIAAVTRGDADVSAGPRAIYHMALAALTPLPDEEAKANA